MVPDSEPLSIGFFLLLSGYVLGSIPFGYIAGRIRGIDIRRFGSQNIGFTNVARIMGWRYAVPVLLLDMLKGFLPVLLSGWIFKAVYSGTDGVVSVLPDYTDLSRLLAGLGAILGHMFTPVLKFRGGKGVATTAGVILALTPVAFLVCFCLFLLVLLSSRYLSLASITASIALPVCVGLMNPKHSFLLLFTVAVAGLILMRHFPNIRRLITGNEPHFLLHRQVAKKLSEDSITGSD